MSMARRQLKIKVTGQGQDRGLGNAVGLTSIKGSLFSSAVLLHALLNLFTF